MLRTDQPGSGFRCRRHRIPVWSAWANGRRAGTGYAPDPNKRYITLAPVATVLGLGV